MQWRGTMFYNIVLSNISFEEALLLDDISRRAIHTVSETSGIPMTWDPLFCYEQPHLAAIYDSKENKVGVHKRRLEQAMRWDDRMYSTLVHEFAHHQFVSGLGKEIHGIFRRNGVDLHDGIKDSRIQAINEGYAYAMQYVALGEAMKDGIADEYINTIILEQYYGRLCELGAPLAKSFLHSVKEIGV